LIIKWLRFYPGFGSSSIDFQRSCARVVGSILGVTKDVDMVFTRKHDICHLHVLVLDPNLIL
jgi:hypothetical protein